MGTAVLAAAPYVLQGLAQREAAKGTALEAQLRTQQATRNAQQSKIEATIARTAADETDTQLREELRTTLGNIQAIRASANVGVDSGTAQALRGEETRVSERERRIRRFNANQKARAAKIDALMFESEAIFHRRSARYALKGARLAEIGSYVQAGAAAADKVASAASAGGGGGGP